MEERLSGYESNFSADSRQVQFGSELRLLDREEIAHGNHQPKSKQRMVILEVPKKLQG